MKYIIISGILLLGFGARAQKITRLSPPNITFRASSVADYTHWMVVGDSASVFARLGVDSIWHQETLPCDKSHTIHGVTFYDTQHAAVVTDGGLIFTTTDAGLHWASSGVGMTGQTLHGIIHTQAGTILAVGDSGIILRSTDSGTSWAFVPSGTVYNINAVAINPYGRGFLVGSHGLIERTANFGKTWTYVGDTIRGLGINKGPITFRSVDIATTGNAGMAVGDSGGIARTSNGTTWNAVSASTFGYANADSSVMEPFFERRNYTSICYANPQGVDAWAMTGDVDLYLGWEGTGLTWENVALNGAADGMTDFGMTRANSILYWRNNADTLYQYCAPYEDVETTKNEYFPYWQGFIDPGLAIPQMDFLDVSIDSTGMGYASMCGGPIGRTSDNGLTWHLVHSYINLYATDIFTLDSSHAFTVGSIGRIFQTSNGGTTWNIVQIDTNQEQLHGIARPSPNIFVVCGDYGTIARSIDTGKSWSDKTSVVPTTEFLEAIAFSSADTGVAVGTNGAIIRTIDQGLTWKNVNNQLSGTSSSFYRLQAFPSGTYYATSDSAGLFRSTDHGLNWEQVQNVPHSMGMELFSERTGVVAESGWSSYSCLPPDPNPTVREVYDTARFAFTRDAFATKPIEWTMPIINNGRMCFHFLDSNTFVCYGSDGFVVKVDMSNGGASVTHLLSSRDTSIYIYPNPTTGDFRIDYTTKSTGSVSIQLFSEDGKDMGMLFSGTEEAGEHEQTLSAPQELHGNLFLRITKDGAVETVPVSFQ